jgi:hypothetical protein
VCALSAIAFALQLLKESEEMRMCVRALSAIALALQLLALSTSAHAHAASMRLTGTRPPHFPQQHARCPPGARCCASLDEEDTPRPWPGNKKTLRDWVASLSPWPEAFFRNSSRADSELWEDPESMISIDAALQLDSIAPQWVPRQSVGPEPLPQRLPPLDRLELTELEEEEEPTPDFSE